MNCLWRACTGSDLGKPVTAEADEDDELPGEFSLSHSFILCCILFTYYSSM